MRAPMLAGAALLLAGCLAAPPPAAPGGTLPEGDHPARIQFGEATLIDDLRAGGEPVVAVTHNGVLVVSAHPGFTHYHPSSPLDPPEELLLPYAGQSYIWRSTDNGTTWAAIGLPGGPGGFGPRGLGPGASDPEFTLTANNRLWHTDLDLAEATVSWSDDDGATWVQGNPIASGGPVDRQWLASLGDTVFFTANYFTDHRILASQDGITWQRVGDVPCSGDLVGANDVLYAGCGPGIAVSLDQGATWEQRGVPGHEPTGRALQEPAVDGAGNVWVAWEEEEQSLWLAGSPDDGATWPWIHDLTSALRTALPGQGVAIVWPWVSAGSAGRIAVTAYVSPTPEPSGEGAEDRPWNVVTVAAFGADAAQPRVAAHVVKALHHLGPICQSGTACQVGSVQGDAGSDRRLGDFFETTLDHQGFLLVVFSDTTARPGDVVSHPGFVRQLGGPSFVVDGYRPTQG